MKLTAANIAGATDILEHLTGENPAHERNSSRRVFAEVTRAWPGTARDLWWKWFSEASDSLGLVTKTLDCTPAQAFELVRNNARVVMYYEDDAENASGRWLAVLSRSRKRYKVIQHCENSNSSNSISTGTLKKELARYAVNGLIRCVVIKSTESALSSDHTLDGHKYTPFQRLWKLLKPELSDIWIVLVFAFVVSILMLATPIAVETLVNTVAFGRFLQPILILALLLFMFLGFQGAIRALQTYVVEIIQRRMFARVAGDLAYRLPRAEQESVDNVYFPELANRFFDVVTVQKVAAQLLLDGLSLILGTIISMVVLGFYHPWLLGFDLFLVASIAVIIFVLGRGAVTSAIKESKHKYYMAAWLEDLARCPTAFRIDGGAEFALERSDRLIHEYLNARRAHFRIVMRQVLFALGLQAVASTILLGLGGWLVISGELTLGQLVAAELIVTVIVGSFAKFGKHMESFYDLLASVDKLGILFDVPTERSDGMLTIDRSEPVEAELNSVSYCWPGQPDVIRSFDLRVKKGNAVAVLGNAGSGKSTLLELISGLRSPTSGHLTIDGFDPRDLRPDILRSRIALVGNGEVFHGTVEENVHMHRAGVTSTAVRDVLDSIGLLEPVLKLNEGFNTKLASDGAPLSYSQCQLLSLARATIGRPGLLLVDGTLDALSQHDLNRCLDFLLSPDRTWTLIVATSREDIASRLDHVVSLDSNFAPDPLELQTVQE